ncbi:MAG: hypothetical protein Q8Q24_00110 [bacterium]|nr:hypothetical protein [bacterium]
MRKVVFVLLILFLFFVSVTTAWAYSGSHSFLFTTTTSDGHVYQSEYQATGSFPFNGQGRYDRSRVNLKGTLNVLSIDGVVSSDSYCAGLKGSLSATGGKLTATQYVDNTCGQVAQTKTYIVISYTENQSGSFQATVKDNAGIISTISGIHQFVSGK